MIEENLEEKNLFEELDASDAIRLETEDLVAEKSFSKASLQKQAEKLEKKIENANKAINKKKTPTLALIIQDLSSDEELIDIGEFPDWKKIGSNDLYSKVLNEMKNIVAKYRDGKFDLIQAREDVLRLSSYSIYLSECLGIYQGHLANAEKRYERTREIAYIKAKNSAKTLGTNITDSDAKEIAKYFAREIGSQIMEIHPVERYLFNAFYSLRNFQETLNMIRASESKLVNTPVTAGPA